MSDQDNPGTTHVRLIRSEALAVLKGNGDVRLHPDQIIMLAALLFADEEGIAYMNPKSIQRWCARPGQYRASERYVQRRIDAMIDAGVLAPGSTPLELRSMIGRSAYSEVAEEAA